MSLLLVQADARRLPFADASVQCCITSPPYFGLRDYGTARWEGGDPACDHLARLQHQGGAESSGLRRDGRQHTGTYSAEKAMTAGVQFGRSCGKCGAMRIDQQIGLEPTIDAYVAQLVTVFREVWRVLKPDGVCWLNLGDSFASNSCLGRKDQDRPNSQDMLVGLRGRQNNTKTVLTRRIDRITDGLKPKDLCMIPARVALALQADGWYLRSEIVWSKPNPMPESVTDRPTKAHEMIYLLAKSSSYYFDADAVREELAPWNPKWGNPVTPPKIGSRGGTFETDSIDGVSRIASAEGSCNVKLRDRSVGRNIRSVWHIATQPYPGAHFATFPEKLVERCVLAGSRPGDVVLDPFMGSGTVARVALRLGREAIGCDLNPQYLRLADDRTRVTYGLPLEDGEVA